jgi:monofunctional biosynthetic peptidoglycan transglycosylase
LRRKAAASTRKRGAGAAQWINGVLAVGFAVLVYGYVTLPDVRELRIRNPTTTAFMELRADEARREGRVPRHVHHWVKYGQISQNLKRAVLVAEDAAFWAHDGVDYVELQKSIELDWARGQMIRGASTITQQLAKNLYLSPSRNPLRKLRELAIARRLEAELSKARILELYLNVIEWGDGIYGADAAARTYFGVSPSALAPSASALLAGAIVNPRLLNPAKPTPRLLRRQQIILARMGAVSPPSPPPLPSRSPEIAPDPTLDVTPEAAPDAPDPAPSPGASPVDTEHTAESK